MKAENGAGLAAPSLRKRSSGSIVPWAVNRCERLIWNASPAAMYSIARRTRSR